MGDLAFEQLVDDLEAEHAALDTVMASLSTSEWDLPSTADGWTVRDCISHLAFFDGTARVSVIDGEAFADDLRQGLEMGIDAYMDRPLRMARDWATDDVLVWWRERRRALIDALRAADPSSRFAWYGPPMSAKAFTAARLMETWAHGQDVFDTLDLDRRPTVRLRHVADIGVRTRGWSYTVRGATAPTGAVAVRLLAPDGSTWAWGDAAADSVVGPALDFCLVVTQRRHVDDTTLQVTGPAARDWMVQAQAFAGAPTLAVPGR